MNERLNNPELLGLTPETKRNLEQVENAPQVEVLGEMSELVTQKAGGADANPNARHK